LRGPPWAPKAQSGTTPNRTHFFCFWKKKITIFK
jgi:hypothetical protein